MRLPLRKWGNSLGVRIPKTFAVQLGIHEGEEIDIRVDNNIITISNPHASLDALLERITDENIHDETDTGHPIGQETW